MCFRLLHEESEQYLSLPFEGQVEERLLQVIRGSESPLAADRARSELALRMVDLVAALLDGKLLPPSEKQLKYAVAIARELALQLPEGVLQYRESMKLFLDTHAEEYRRRKGYDKPRSGPQN